MAYFLLEDKSKLSYSTALGMLKQHCPDLDVETVLVDFEQAEHKALKEHFPDAIPQGCLYHWKQCLIRRFQKIPGYTSQPPNFALKERLHYIFGLAYIPVADVVSSWAVLKRSLERDPVLQPFKDSVDAILQYVESTWVLNPTIYPVEMWNVHNAVLYGSPRTNNVSEGTNNALNMEASCSHPELWRLLEILLLFNQDTETAILHIVTGQPPKSNRSKKVIEWNQRVLNTVQHYGRFGVLMFCKAIGLLSY